MIAERTLRVLVLLVAAGGCNMASDDAPPGDAGPTLIDYERFTSQTWSLSTTGSAAQLSISDKPGAAACALSTDRHNTLGGPGVEILVHLPGAVTGTCPVKEYTLNKNCAANLGAGVYVPEGCAYFRKWDAQGAEVGITVVHDGLINFIGDATSCTIRASITFIGNSFSETFVLSNGTGMQPWCRDS
jgi:hypothetical protein